MEDDLQTGTVEVPADDTRSEILRAIDEQRSRQEVAPERERPEPAEPHDKDERRDAKGRFRPQESEADPQQPAPKEEAAATGEPEAKPDAEEPLRAPASLSPKGKVAFDKLGPEFADLKREIVKREEDVSKGFARYEGLANYADRAERNGTTLQNAVRDYHEIETSLRGDFTVGIEAICKRFGVNPLALANAIATKLYRPEGDQAQPGRTEDRRTAQQAIDPDALLEAARREARQVLNDQTTQGQIEAFANDPKNRFFANVRGSMARLIEANSATSLQDAYDQACWANPEIREILLNERTVQAAPAVRNATVVANARAAAKTTIGGPAPGFKPSSGPPPENIRDTIRQAIADQRG